MRNRIVGYLIIGISLFIGILVWLFNRALTSIVNESCSHGPTCPMWGSIKFQTNVGILLMAIVLLVGFYFIFFAKDPEPRQVVKKVDKKSYHKVMESLVYDEKLIFSKLLDSDGTIFQSELVEQTGYSKVKVTRILDKLEGKGLIERRRRGMTNVVILKH